MSAWKAWFERILQPFGYTWDVLRVGCKECPPPSEWPQKRLYAYAVTLLVAYLVSRIAGAWPSITSAHRCGPCNKRRDGAEQSRHLAGDRDPRAQRPGKPFAAFDLQWESKGPVRRLIPYLRAAQGAGGTFLGEYVRQWFSNIGLPAPWTNIGVGVIVYGRRIHLDLRDDDYVDVKERSGLSDEL